MVLFIVDLGWFWVNQKLSQPHLLMTSPLFPHLDSLYHLEFGITLISWFLNLIIKRWNKHEATTGNKRQAAYQNCKKFNELILRHFPLGSWIEPKEILQASFRNEKFTTHFKNLSKAVNVKLSLHAMRHTAENEVFYDRFFWSKFAAYDLVGIWLPSSSPKSCLIKNEPRTSKDQAAHDD